MLLFQLSKYLSGCTGRNCNKNALIPVPRLDFRRSLERHLRTSVGSFQFWAAVDDGAFFVLSGIFQVSNETRATPRLVSLRGVIQKFPTPFLSESPPPSWAIYTLILSNQLVAPLLLLQEFPWVQADEGSTLKESIMIPLKSTTAGILKVIQGSLCYLRSTVRCGGKGDQSSGFYVFHSLRLIFQGSFFRKCTWTKHLTQFCILILDAAFCRRMC